MALAGRLVRNTLYRTVSLVVGSFSGLFITVFLARILKPEQFGVYSLVISISMLTVIFTDLGINGAVVRYTAYYVGRANFKKVRGHFKYFLKLKIFLTIVASLLIIVFSGNIASFFNIKRFNLLFVFAGIMVFFSSLTDFINVFFYGLQEFKYTLIRQVVYECVRWTFVLPLSYIFLVLGAIIGHTIAYFVSFTIFLIILFTRYRHYIFGESEDVDRNVLSFIGFMTLARISGILYAYVDIIMIGYLLTPTDVGYYKAAYTIVFAIVGFISVADVLYPAFTQIEKGSLNDAVNMTAKYVSTISFPTAFLLMFFSRYIIKIIYGASYLEASYPLSILSLILIPASFSYLLVIFNAKNMPKYSAILSVFGMILNILLNYILIKLIGIRGAALATLISRSLVISAGAYILYRIFKIKVTLRSFIKQGISAFLMLFLLIFMTSMGLVTENITIALIACVFYIFMLFSLKGLCRKDIEYLITLFRQ